jgi:hypothetical protein
LFVRTAKRSPRGASNCARGGRAPRINCIVPA